MWIEETPVGFYRASNHVEHVRYVARRLWLAYTLRHHPDDSPKAVALRLGHVRGLMRKWALTWEQVTDECTVQGYEEAVAWWVERRLGGGS